MKLLVFVVLAVLVHQSYQQQKCNQTVNCIAPGCLCMSTSAPAGLGLADTPQLVFLTFNGAIQAAQMLNYTNILNRKNPNGCPISATFFTSHQYNDYSATNKLYNTGNEIGDNTLTSSARSYDTWLNMPANQWTDEISGMISVFTKFANIPSANIRGFRAPYLVTSGDPTYQGLKNVPGIVYDSSFSTTLRTNPPIWPYSLDFGLQHECNAQYCPVNSYPGIWEFPMVAWTNPNGTQNSFVDAWPSSSENETYNYLMDNFNRHYKSNKAPFMINLNSNSWFGQHDTAFRMTAFSKFLNDILANKDVFIVSMGKGADWMKNPTKLSDVSSTSGPLACPSVSQKLCSSTGCYYDADSVPQDLSGDRFMMSCAGCPNTYPWIGNLYGN